MLAVEILGVTKRFGGRSALRELNLSLEQGASIGLLGPNGAGKTTTIRLLLGFVRPTHGVVRMHGRDPSDPESRRALGYLPEKLSLPARMTIREFLALHAALAGLTRSERQRDVDEVLELTGIADRDYDRLGSLSKGLRQRVGFAQALLGRPDILLLDEPTSGLDPIGVRDARDWIQAARQRGCSVLVSSHILSEVERTCDEVAILHEGRVAASGTVDEIVRAGESLEDAFVRVVRG